MIQIFQIAIQTIFGWTVLTCGVPADDFLVDPPDTFTQINYACVVEIDGDKYGLKGMFYRLDVEQGKPFTIPGKSTLSGDEL